MAEQEKGEWYVVYTKAHKEDFARFHLRLKGLNVFLPRLLLPESVRKRSRVVPLFPNYLFVHIHLSKEFHYVAWSPGVKCFVAFNGIPTPLGDAVINFFMEQADTNGIISGRSNLKPGQEVRVNGGPLDGLVGLIQKPPDGRGRVKVLMKLLSRELNVEVPAQYIDSGWVPSEQPARQTKYETAGSIFSAIKS